MVKYNILIGKSKNEVIQELGEGFNYYPDNYWFYDMKRVGGERKPPYY
ncbi:MULTISPECIES: hypothetical protein [Elizabethkingia]|nr:hypothetical protein [Elizabethkingia anophelis]